MLDIQNIFLLVSIIKIAFNRAAECVKVAYFLSYIKLQLIISAVQKRLSPLLHLVAKTACFHGNPSLKELSNVWNN